MEVVLNKERFEQALTEYKKKFVKIQWVDERYKWDAIKVFQDNWNIDAENFAEMFYNATIATGNLLGSMNFYPRNMIVEFAKIIPDHIRGMFANLFDESKPLANRIEKFLSDSDNIRSLLPEYGGLNHYQNLSTISTYLWLRYPDKYTIYRYETFKNIVEKLEIPYKVRRKNDATQLEQYFKVNRFIGSLMSKDMEMKELFSACVDENSYSDPNLTTLAMDFGRFIKRSFMEDDWWPSLFEYDPKISKEQWKEYIINNEFEHADAMQMLKAIFISGGQASCKELSEKFGGRPERYIGCTTGIGRRARVYFNLEPYMDKDYNCERLYIVPFLGKMLDTESGLYYHYKLRPALQEALAEIDLSGINEFYITPTEENDVVATDPTNTVNELELYTEEAFLREVYIDEQELKSLEQLIKLKKNVILQGAPGVGKTYMAKRLAYVMMKVQAKDRVQVVQFHQNYSYEDFIMGYKPTEDGKFKLTNGIFYDFCQKARADKDNKYFFIIDEINRGNLSKIFGELMMLIENDHREESVALAYKPDESFSVPENLYIIGMMNTADRSLAMIDYALRRRFSFYTVKPAFDNETFNERIAKYSDSRVKKVIEKVVSLNKAIMSDASLGEGFVIGHSYFCVTEKDGKKWIDNVVNYDIIPMLREYWFDNNDEYNKHVSSLKEALNDNA